jgi:hypothetical protein
MTDDRSLVVNAPSAGTLPAPERHFWGVWIKSPPACRWPVAPSTGSVAFTPPHGRTGRVSPSNLGK